MSPKLNFFIKSLKWVDGLRWFCSSIWLTAIFQEFGYFLTLILALICITLEALTFSLKLLHWKHDALLEGSKAMLEATILLQQKVEMHENTEHDDRRFGSTPTNIRYN